LLSRRGWNMTERVPELATFPARGIFDGELVAYDEETRPSFRSSPTVFCTAGRRPGVMFAVFDVLEIDGERTMRLPYSERRRLLGE
jgi:ATP-dependent DNA ligase